MTRASEPVGRRIASIDVVRGAVMVLMAIDHVRVYSGVPAGGPSPGVFFTRWVTHFCAPVFVFLAGTSAYLVGRKLGDRGRLARHLVTRGAVLIVLELTVIRASWTFGFDYSEFILAGVIWMLGWCMMLLAGLVWLPTWAIGAVGVLVIALQDVFGPLGKSLPQPLQVVWEFIYPIGLQVRLREEGPNVAVLYSIVPWIGVMAAGYAFGALVVRDTAESRRAILRIGLAATAVFILAAGLGLFLRGSSEGAPPAWVQVLNQRKYPASQLFLLMTLGPSIALMPAAERARAWVLDVLAVFGRVPMFYYLLHIPVIHALALVFWLARDGTTHADWFATAPFVSVDPAHRWGLPLLYLVFLAAVAILYLPCRWFADVKSRKQSAWLRYL
jgi:uncharacterized membrane protein